MVHDCVFLITFLQIKNTIWDWFYQLKIFNQDLIPVPIFIITM
jgi:hypothetical protein